MTEFKDTDTLKAWLRNRPPEFSCILATRASLRIVPLLNQALRRNATARLDSVVLPCFRALATAYFMSAWPARAGEVRNNGRHAYLWANEMFTNIINSAERDSVELTEIGEEIFPDTHDVHGLRKSDDIVRAATLSVLTAVETMEPDATGYENIAIRGALLGHPPARVRERMDEIAAFTGLGDYLAMPIHTYSTGSAAAGFRGQHLYRARYPADGRMARRRRRRLRREGQAPDG